MNIILYLPEIFQRIDLSQEKLPVFYQPEHTSAGNSCLINFFHYLADRLDQVPAFIIRIIDDGTHLVTGHVAVIRDE